MNTVRTIRFSLIAAASAAALTFGGGFGLAMNQWTDNPDVGWPWNDTMSSWKGSSC